MGAVDSPNLYAFVGWGPHVGRDPMGEEVYLVFRQFDDETLKRGYEVGGVKVIGHFFLAFDGEGLDNVGEWRDLVDRLGTQFDPRRDAFYNSETFSFHPWEVREATDPTTGLPVTHGATNDKSHTLAGKAYTVASYVGYNDRVDRDSFRQTRDGLLIKGAKDSEIIPLDLTQKQQQVLYELAIKSRNINNKSPEGNDMGFYSLNDNNCGTWARWMLERVGIQFPAEAELWNAGGVGVGGPADRCVLPPPFLPIPLPKQLSIAAAVIGEANRPPTPRPKDTPPKDGVYCGFWGCVKVEGGKGLAVSPGGGVTP